MIKLEDYIKSVTIEPTQLDNQAMCANKWIHTYVYLGASIVKNCHNVPNRFITEEEMDLYGTDIFTNHPYEIERRKEKLNNIKHDDCINCWKCESRGLISARLAEGYYEFHRKRLNVDRGTEAVPSILEVYFTNTCDQKCIYCIPQYSSQWEAEMTKYGDNFLIHKESNNTKFKKLFYQWLEEEAVKTVMKFQILGGEPLIQDEFYEFTNKLYDILKTVQLDIKPSLVVVSNGNTPKAYLNKWFKQIEKLQSLITVQIDFSMESTTERAEFIRTNLDWKRFESNVKETLALTKEYDLKVRFSCTHSALSLPTFYKFLEWTGTLGDYNFDYTRSRVVDPPEIAPWMLTENFSTHIDKSIEWIDKHKPELTKYKNFMLSIKNSLGKHSKEQLAAVPDFIEKLEYRRDLNFKKTFPELQEWYDKCLEERNKCTQKN